MTAAVADLFELEELPRVAWRTALRGREADLWEQVRLHGHQPRMHLSAQATLVLADAVDWLRALPPDCLHAVVTDPPYGLAEYEDKNHQKLRSGRGGSWRIPPSFDGAKRMPVPRFTVLTPAEMADLQQFFATLAHALLRVLVPGGHVFIASNPLLSTVTFSAIQGAGFEKRGEVIRLVQTLRGGDRPKGAEQEFDDVSAMARSCWEPWGLFRKPFNGTTADNLRRWGTGGLRRISADEPFKDVIPCAPTRATERSIAPHPSLKPQRFLRQVVRAALPLGIGIVLDPFAGSASTLAAAQSLGYKAVATERDQAYFEMGRSAFDGLSALGLADR
jgi:DNA modification methylase